jgi:hypothetical protein
MRKVVMVVLAVEERMVKLVVGEETAETQPSIAMESTVRMVLGAASKLISYRCDTKSDGA